MNTSSATATTNKPSRFFTRPFVVFSLAIFCTMLWGSAYPAIKTGYQLLAISPHDIPSQITFAGERFLLAGIFLLALAKATGRDKIEMTPIKIRQIVSLGFIQTTLPYIFFYMGMAFSTGVKASILNSTGTFFSVLLAHFIYKNDRLNRRKSIGCLVGFLGVFAANFNQSLAGFNFTLADASIVFAAFILAAASIYGKKISQKIDPVVMTACQLSIGGLTLLVIGVSFGGDIGHFNLNSALVLIYLASLSATTFALWSTLLKYNPVGMVAVFNFLIPIFGSLLSALFLNESILEWKNLIALIFVCSGIYIVTQTPETPENN